MNSISGGAPLPPGQPAAGGTSGDAGASPAPLRPGRVAARMARVVENALGHVDLSLPQYRMLIFLAESGSEAASGLAGKLGVSRPSVTALVDGLVARGWVERCADPLDRRRVTHTVTPAGRQVLARADDAVEARLADLSRAAHDDAERAEAYTGLGRWQAAMDAEREAKLQQQ
ncbi:MAG: MarR family winged helix-turn-helix transcriptional regulator [Acidimicrobiales bacterium]